MQLASHPQAMILRRSSHSRACIVRKVSGVLYEAICSFLREAHRYCMGLVCVPVCCGKMDFATITPEP